MSDLIKRAKSYLTCGGMIGEKDAKDSTSELARDLLSALENPAHAWLMVAAEKCREYAQQDWMVEYPQGITAAENLRHLFEKLASEYPPSVCVPVDELKKLRDTVVLLQEKLKEAEAMIAAARKP